MLIILWVPEQTNKNKVQTEQALRRGPVKLQCATLRKCVWVGVGVAGGGLTDRRKTAKNLADSRKN